MAFTWEEWVYLSNFTKKASYIHDYIKFQNNQVGWPEINNIQNICTIYHYITLKLAHDELEKTHILLDQLFL